MNPVFEQLKKQLDRVQAMSMAMTLFHWDNATCAPKQGIETTAKAMGILSGELYHALINDNVKDLMHQLEKENDLDEFEQAVLKELKKTYEDLELIPAEEYQAFSELTSASQHVWQEAKEKNDFSMFAPTLDKIIFYQKKFADYALKAKGTFETRYDKLLNDYEEGFTTKELDDFFGKLKETIVPLVKMVSEKKDKIKKEYASRSYPIEKQREFNEWIARYVGFDFDRGVMAESAHPFTTELHNKDVRITTAYMEDLMESAIFSTIHESGHAVYEMDVDDQYTFSIVGGGTSMGMHESQSRLYENNIGRSRAFWEPIFPKLKECFQEQLEDVDLDTFFIGINKAEPSLIRTEADELTYCLHIMVRYEIEKMFINNDLKTEEIKEIWNQKYEEYLGIRPENDAEGVLQDVHWSQGSIGYFPSYAIGNAVAAQIYAHLQKVMPVEEYLRKGTMAPIIEYLKEHVHRFGKTKNMQQILVAMTGEGFNPDYYTTYLKEKYTAIYENL